MAKHMDSAVRGQIQFWIESHRSVAWIARALGKPPSTVWRETLDHRIPSDKGYGCSNRLCAKFDACTRPFACSRRRPHRKPETRANAKCRVGRTMKELHAWLQAHPGATPTEVDTAVGSISGKVPCTMCFPKSRLALAFLRDSKTSQTTTRVFNMPWDLAGPKLSRRLFAVVLPDNGPEFSDPAMIEMHRPDPAHNPTKLVPRGVKAFFCDPHCPSQKPHVERVHVELRRIFEKGAPFDSLRQEHVNLAMSHVNSPARDSLGGKCAYDAFVEEFGAEGRTLLDALGMRRIPASEVTLHPFLLGERFQRIADRAVPRGNGIGKPGTDGLRE